MAKTKKGATQKRPATVVKPVVKRSTKPRPRHDHRPNKKYDGTIRADEAYSLRELFSKLGIGRTWVTDAKAAGLKLIVIGRQRGVLGSELLRYFATTQGK